MIDINRAVMFTKLRFSLIRERADIDREMIGEIKANKIHIKNISQGYLQ